jgi:hypothetical protein
MRTGRFSLHATSSRSADAMPAITLILEIAFECAGGSAIIDLTPPRATKPHVVRSVERAPLPEPDRHARILPSQANAIACDS